MIVFTLIISSAAQSKLSFDLLIHRSLVHYSKKQPSLTATREIFSFKLELSFTFSFIVYISSGNVCDPFSVSYFNINNLDFTRWNNTKQKALLFHLKKSKIVNTVQNFSKTYYPYLTVLPVNQISMINFQEITSITYK